MRSLMSRLKGLTELLLLTVLLMVGFGGQAVASWYKSPGSDWDSGFTGQAQIVLEMSADKTTLPVNILNAGPQIGSPYTNTITIQIKQNGTLFNAPSVNVAIVSGLNSGVLFRLDGNDEEDDDGNITASRNIVYTDTGGVITTHLHALSAPGPVVISASAADPQTGQIISANLTINVTGGGNANNPPAPASVTFVMDPAPVYIRTNPDGTTTVPQSNTKLFQIFVRDDFGQLINPGAGNPLRIEMLPNRPNGGEWLSATGADGSAQQGVSVVSGLFGGAATVILHSGAVPGTVVIAATADRADNNVDNGIQFGIINYAMVSIGTGVVTSLTFAGPFSDAVLARKNNLGAQLIDPTTLGDPFTVEGAKDTLWNGVYTRFISIVASDPYGNPPPAGTPITFRLIDSPLDMLKNRYPDQGHGEFVITGYNGDPQEGGYAFFAPNRTTARVTRDTLNPFVVPNGVSYAIADPTCLLVLQDPEVINPNSSTINALPAEGRLEYHVGSRIITGQQGNMLTVNAPFNQVNQNVGANVWYTVGCPPYKGNVMNFNMINSPVFGTTEVSVMTDSNGVANTVMNYPANQVGRRFMVMAESNGGKVGAVMTHWYLGIADGSSLEVVQSPGIPPDRTTIVVNPGASVNLPVTLQLLDGGVDTDGDGIPNIRTPIPGMPIAVEILINDPAETAAIVAEEAVAKAQAALDGFVAANPGVCDLVLTDPAAEPGPRDPAKCAQQTALTSALDGAKATAIQARTVANLHTPTASVVPAVLSSVGGGYVRFTLQVNDLPTDGSVDFYFSTIGPDIRTGVLKMTVTTQQPAEPEPEPAPAP